MKKYRVLVVDDDASTLQLVCAVLEANGIPCLSAGGGAQALQLMRAHPELRLIVTDVNMPEMNGLMFVRHVASMFESLAAPRVIFLTAHPSVQLAISALRLGAADFLIKPIRPSQLVAVVQRVLGGAAEKPGYDGPGTLPQPAVPTAGAQPEQSDVTGRALLGIDELRKLRRSHPLLRELDDTAFELLLELLRAERAGQHLSVSALSISIDNDRVSAATALRRIQDLVRASHIARVPDPWDARRELVSLEPQTRDSLELYLKQVAEAFTAVAHMP